MYNNNINYTFFQYTRLFKHLYVQFNILIIIILRTKHIDDLSF